MDLFNENELGCQALNDKKQNKTKQKNTINHLLIHISCHINISNLLKLYRSTV